MLVGGFLRIFHVKKVNNWKKADINGLKDTILHTPWDLTFKEDCIDTSVNNWTDLLLRITDEHVPKITISDNGCSPGIDRDVIQLMRKKTICVIRQREPVRKQMSRILLKLEERLRGILKQNIMNT